METELKEKILILREELSRWAEDMNKLFYDYCDTDMKEAEYKKSSKYLADMHAMVYAQIGEMENLLDFLKPDPYGMFWDEL